MEKQWTDEAIIQAINGKKHEGTEALKQLYLNEKLKKAINRQFYKLGGNSFSAKGFFHHVLLIFYDKVKSGDFQLTKGAILPYIVNIAKKQQYSQYRSEKRRASRWQKASRFLQQELFFLPKFDDFKEDKELLDQSLYFIGERCRALLKLKSQDCKVGEIQIKLQYKSVASTKMALSNCRKKLHTFLDNHPIIKQKLLEYYKYG